MSAPPSQPPGWHHAQGDPPGTHRWWDGTQWVGGPVTSGSAQGHGAFGANYPFTAPFGIGPDYAGFWARLGAMLLENLILTVPLGKRAVGIKTLRVQTGQSLGTGRVGGRFFAHWVSGLLCYLGYFWMLWDGQKQTWHDKMTDAVVVKADH